jgi:hypothetical protein
MEHGVLGADRGIVESGRDGVRERNLTGCVLKDVREGALENAGEASVETRGVIAELLATTSGFDTNELYTLVLEELVENADCV